MIEEVVQDYTAYCKIDLASHFHTVQEVIDNMITRLEELTSVLQIIRMKNHDCSSTVTNDICKYRYEVTVLTRKILTLSAIICTLKSNVDILERQVEKAEIDFGVNNDSKFKSLLRPFLKRNDILSTDTQFVDIENLKISSVTDYFESTNK